MTAEHEELASGWSTETVLSVLADHCDCEVSEEVPCGSCQIEVTTNLSGRRRHGYLKRGVWEPCGDDNDPLAPERKL